MSWLTRKSRNGAYLSDLSTIQSRESLLNTQKKRPRPTHQHRKQNGDEPGGKLGERDAAAAVGIAVRERLVGHVLGGEVVDLVQLDHRERPVARRLERAKQLLQLFQVFVSFVRSFVRCIGSGSQ